jgi:hypothetical protein
VLGNYRTLNSAGAYHYVIALLKVGQKSENLVCRGRVVGVHKEAHFASCFHKTLVHHPPFAMVNLISYEAQLGNLTFERLHQRYSIVVTTIVNH